MELDPERPNSESAKTQESCQGSTLARVSGSLPGLISAGPAHNQAQPTMANVRLPCREFQTVSRRDKINFLFPLFFFFNLLNVYFCFVNKTSSVLL